MHEDELESLDTPLKMILLARKRRTRTFRLGCCRSSISKFGGPNFELMCDFDDLGGDEAEYPSFLLAAEVRYINEVQTWDDEGPEYLDVGEEVEE